MKIMNRPKLAIHSTGPDNRSRLNNLGSGKLPLAQVVELSAFMPPELKQI